MPEEQAQPVQAGAAVEEQASTFLSMVNSPKGFRPNNDSQRDEIDAAVRDLAGWALRNTTLVSDNAVASIEAIVAAMDKVLTEQINKIVHHPDFQKLEGAWRGLHYLVTNTETDETLKIRVLNVSKPELAKTLKNYKGVAWDQSPVFKKLYEEEFGSPGGQPYGAIVGDYYFDHSAPDVELLKGMAQIAAAAHAPFITGTAPTLFGMETWQELSDPRDLTKIFQTAQYAPWRSLRESDDSRYIGMAMPRFLSRLPYGAKTNPVEEFAFEEDCEGKDHGKYTWSNAAYTMARNITSAFKLYGWCSRIRGVTSGGVVEGLPIHTFPTDDGGVDMKCPTEIAVTHRREAELAKNGMMPLSHYKNTDYAAFIGAQSLHQPAVYTDPDATANANLSARLPYMFATCRFAHIIQQATYDLVGSFKERADMEKALHNWTQLYVEPDPDASEEAKAKRPLRAAEVQVLEVPGNPGYYNAKIFLRPHYQLEGLTASLRLVSKLPSVKKGG